MSAVRRIAKNTAVLYLARIVSTGLKFILFVYLARTIGDAELGKFTFAIVFTSFLSILMSLGTDDLLIREVARDKNRAVKYLGNIFVLRIILSVIAFSVMLIVINLMDYPADTRLVVYVFSAYGVVGGLANLFLANFRAFERMQWAALFEILEIVMVSSLGILLLYMGFGLLQVCFVFFFAGTVNMVLSFLLCNHKFTRVKFQFDFNFWKITVIKAVPFSLSMLYIVYARIDTILLSAIKGDAVVGGYNAAYQIVLIFDPFVIAFMSAMVPVISRFFISSQTMLELAAEKSLKYLVMVGFPISVGGMVLADKIIPLLYGTQFSISILVLQIVIWNCLLMSMNRPMLFLLGAINRQGTSALIAIAALILSTGLNFLLIPRWSLIGSSAATLITASLVTVASWYAVSRHSCRLPICRIVLKPMFASLVMGVVLYGSGMFITANILLLVVAGAIIYFAMLLLFKAFSLDDQIFIREVMSIRRAE